MAFDWLFGKSIISTGWGGQLHLGASRTISITDVEEIMSRLSNAGATKVRTVRLAATPMAHPPNRELAEDVELNAQSVDLILDGVAVFADWPEPAQPDQPWRTPISAQVNLGSAVPCLVAVSAHNETAHEAERVAASVAEVITAGRRRIPPWKRAQLAIRLGAIALIAAVGLALYQLRDAPAAGVLLILGAVAFAWEANSQITSRLKTKLAGVQNGTASIDATPIDQIRIQRRERHQNRKVAAVSAIITLIATVLGAGLTAYLRTGTWTPGFETSPESPTPTSTVSSPASR